jgi:hypothetical protein
VELVFEFIDPVCVATPTWYFYLMERQSIAPLIVSLNLPYEKMALLTPESPWGFATRKGTSDRLAWIS